MSIKSLSVKAAKIGSAIIFKILFYLAVGLLINWIFGCIVLWSVEDRTMKLVLMAVFFLGFPAVYAWKARGYAISEGLEEVYERSRDLLEGVVDRITGSVVEKHEQLGANAGIASSVFSGAVSLAKNAERLPRPIRWIIDFFLHRLPLHESLEKISQEVEFKTENMDLIKDRVFASVDEFITDDLLNTGKLWFWILLIINFLAIALTWFFLIKT